MLHTRVSTHGLDYALHTRTHGPYPLATPVTASLFRQTLVLALVATLAGAVSTGAASTSPFEFGAVFTVDGHNLTFTASSVAHMKIVLMAANAATQEGMHALVDSGEVGHCFAATCVDVEAGGELTYNDDSCYTLHVDGATDATFTIHGLIPNSNLAIFTEHTVTEFEGTPHYLREIEDGASVDIEPAAIFAADPTPTVTFSLTASGAVSDYTDAVKAQLKQVVATVATVNVADVSLAITAGSVNLAFTIVVASTTAQTSVSTAITTALSTPAAATTLFAGVTGLTVTIESVDVGAPGKPWGETIAAALLVNAITLAGVVFLIPPLRKCAAARMDLFGSITSAFAAGAILATAFYLVLLEASHTTGGSTESAQAAIWGTLALGGFCTAGILDIIVSLIMGDKVPATSTSSEASKDPESGKKSVELISLGSRARIIGGILIGDFLHNLCDGFFIGSAFLLCGSSKGWGVSAATIYHELAQ